jgi:glutathione synthase/RimK-type ligase-like ATP-grasp enzyme
MTICVVGDTDDLSSVYFGWAARRAGHRVLALDEEQLGVSWSFGFEDPPRANGRIDSDGDRVAFEELLGVFARFNPEPRLPPGVELDANTGQQLRAERRAGLHRLLDGLACPVANRPSAGRSNGSKPLQMAMLEAAGFRVPRWLVSNDVERVREFADGLAAPPIYKAVSGLRSRVRRLGAEALRRLSDGTSPVLVQAYVAGADVRVHVVDAVCHATEVGGLGVDYRFDGSHSYRQCDVPDAIARRCVEVARQEELLLAGFDFRVDGRGRWWCLEVNPMPSFIPYQWATGQPIAESVLDAFAERARVGSAGTARPPLP